MTETTFLSELADLGIALALICVPLATGALFIPLGRALAERLRSPDDLGRIASDPRAVDRVLARLDRIDATLAALSIEVEIVAEHQRALAGAIGESKRLSPGPDAHALQGRVITPH